jgi:hypothetical protein
MRGILGSFMVVALLVTLAAPVAADTTRPVSGTYSSLSSISVGCVPQGARTTCTETYVDANTDVPPTIVVCVNVSTYTYSERTGRGRFISDESGCSDPIDGSALAITVSHDVMTALLAPTLVTLFGCDRQTCTATRTVTASVSDSDGPVETSTSRSSYKDGSCMYRYSESAVRAELAGTLTLDGITIPGSGNAQVSEVKVLENCR